jgi:polyisoprenoid-binding protein YceI
MGQSQRVMRRMKCAVLFIAAGSFCAMPTAVGAQQITFAFNPATTKIEFTLGATLHTVHGTMRLKSGEIRFDPGTGVASGKVVVDATSAETGNKSRDNKMHKEVLESARFPEIVFTAQRVTGTIESTGNSQLHLSGFFEIEGHQHPTALTVSINRDGSGEAASATTKFAAPYVQWGVKNPSTLFLRVSDHVDVEIDARGQLTTAH